MSTHTYNKILSKGIEADLPAQINEGKLRFTTDTRRLFLDVDGQRVEYSDFIKGNTEDEIKGILAPLPKFYLASDTKTLWYYDSGWKSISTEYADESSHSINADTATYANTAGSADTATNASSASYATNAGSATSATNASTANYATNAGSATNATNAGSATNASTANYAKNAGTAANAINADTATFATNAATATYANNAGSATSATNASTANYANNAGAANTALTATNASTASYATSAGKATNDGNGANIADTYAPKASPVFTGTPTTPDVAAGDSTGKIANTKFVTSAVASAIAGVTQFDYEVVTELPATGVKGKIYLVASGSVSQNLYDEYIWIGDKYEKLGSTQMDLSNYVNNVVSSGTGNAVTGFSKNGNTLTLTKGSTFLTAHPAVTHNSSTASATPAAGSNIDVITSITTDNFGHASSFVKTTMTLPNSVASATNASTADYAKNAGTAAYSADVPAWAKAASKPTYTKSEVGLGNVDNTADANKNVASAVNASTADYAKNGISNITRSGLNFTVTRADGSTFTFNQQDMDTTYTKSSLGLGNVTNYDQSKAIKSITRSGNTFTATALDNTTFSFDQKDNDTTYGNFTSAAAGLAPASGGGTTKYLRADGSWQVPPNTNSTYALVEGSANGTVNFNANGTTANVAVHGLGALAYKASLGKADVGLGNVDNTADANKSVASATNASTANYAKNGISNITRSGTNFTVTKADGSTFTFNQQDSNTTYGNVSTAAAGLAPKVTNTAGFLKGDGTWGTPGDTTYSLVSTAANGLAPKVTSTSGFLKGDGTWATPTNTTYSTFTSSANGLAPASGGGTTKYLRADGSWQVPPDNNTTYDLSPYATKASPTFTGSPTTPDVAAGDSSTKIANTKFVTSAISTAIAGVTQFDYEVVTSLPTTGVKGKIYLVANSGPTQNIYDEYIWIGDKYEKLGTTQIDLSNYINNVVISGTGNAVTTMTKSGNTLTLTKGTTFPTSNSTYTANNGVGISGNTFYNSGVRAVSQGTANGTINVNTNGSTADVSVKGLAALAYKASLGKADVGLGNVANVDQSKAIKSITRSGLTFTATALDNTTFSFTQQDSNTTYSFSNNAPTLAWNSASTIGTVGGVALTVKMPANPNTNTTYSAGTGLSLSGTAFSLATTGLAHTYGPSANVTGSNNTTIAVPQITTDAYGRVTSVTNRTYTSVNTDNDTKNTAGSTDTSSKIFLIGATSQAANPQTYSDNEVYATSGVLTAKSLQVGGGSATIQYNSNTQSIDFVFA